MRFSVLRVRADVMFKGASRFEEFAESITERIIGVF